MTLALSNHGVCKLAVAPVRANPSDQSEIITQLLFGDYVHVLALFRSWIMIRIERDDLEGWMDAKQLVYITDDEYNESHRVNHQLIVNQTLDIDGPYGVQTLLMGGSLPNLGGDTFGFGDQRFTLMQELEDRTASPVDTSLRYLNTPYLWGGKSPFGIDCSGLTQMVAKLHGIDVPRNASQQVNHGETVGFEDRRAADIVFFSNHKGVVNHLGILLEKDIILHASGWVRRDQVDETGIFRSDFDDYTHIFHSVRRWFQSSCA